MLKLNQHTLSKPINFKGYGLHTGNTSAQKFWEASQGIIFKQ